LARKALQGQRISIGQFVPMTMVGRHLQPAHGSRSTETFGGVNGAGFVVDVQDWLAAIARGDAVDCGQLARAAGIGIDELRKQIGEAK
jgi:hypothetical protein